MSLILEMSFDLRRTAAAAAISTLISSCPPGKKKYEGSKLTLSSSRQDILRRVVLISRA